MSLAAASVTSVDTTSSSLSTASPCLPSNVTVPFGLEQSLTIWQGYVLFAGLALTATLVVAKGSNAIRKRLHGNKGNVDESFDAGGKVSSGIIATTIVSHWTWAASLLQSTAVTAKYGISGAFWYASGATIQVLLFSMLTVQLKIRAPGAKTFLQLIRARFGRRTHITFCVFALLTNVIVTAMLLLGGASVLTNLIQGFSVELATLLVAAVVSSYTFMGGMAATIYVSYFNTAIMMILMLAFTVNVFYTPRPSDINSPIGSIEAIFENINSTLGPDGNYENSYLTMLSFPGLMFGIINIVGNFGTVFVDQSYWQCGVAAQPRQGVIGFLAGGMTWFAVPFTFASTMGLAYLSISAQNGAPLLTLDQVNQGLVAPAVAQWILGPTGELMVVLMVVMAVTSTGAAEVLAVTSILVYDIYQLYLKPYRLVFDPSTCVLCGRERGRNANPRDKCICISQTYCRACNEDDQVRAEWKRAVLPDYKCVMHGPFRTYNDYLNHKMNWCQICVAISIIPFTLLLEVLGISLGWMYLFMGVLIGSAVVPITLTLYWSRLTAVAMMSGSIGGAVLGVIAWLAVAAVQPGGLSDFFNSTGSELAMLAGNLVSILAGAAITIVVTFATNREMDETSIAEIWEGTRDIDNPLRPWSELYAKEIGLSRVHSLEQRPSLADIENKFHLTKVVTWVVSLALTFILIVVWPLATVSAWAMDKSQFTSWVTVVAVYGFLATTFIVVLPIVTELHEIRNLFVEQNSVDSRSLVSEAIPPHQDEKIMASISTTDIGGLTSRLSSKCMSVKSMKDSIDKESP